MAKTFLFVRGPKTALRLRLTQNLRGIVPDAVWIAMDQAAEDPKKAHAACVAQTKEALQQPGDRLLIVDNESLKPIHWQAYYAIAERKHIHVDVIGIDVLDDADEEAKNLQLQNSALFIALVDKYWCVKNELDADEVENWFKTMRERTDAVDSGTA
jgi:hypothetical protein